MRRLGLPFTFTDSTVVRIGQGGHRTRATRPSALRSLQLGCMRLTCAFWGMMVNGAIWIRAPTSPKARRGALVAAGAASSCRLNRIDVRVLRLSHINPHRRINVPALLRILSSSRSGSHLHALLRSMRKTSRSPWSQSLICGYAMLPVACAPCATRGAHEANP